MNKINRYLLVLVAFFPFNAFATGLGDSLDWFGIHFFVVLVFIVFLVFAGINWIGKVIMLLIFIVSEYLNAKLTIGLPTPENLMMLKVISASAPIFTTIASYWALRTNFRKK